MSIIHDHDDRQLDEELAAMTDAFLNNPNLATPTATGDLRRYDDIVRDLYAFLNDDGPSAAFEQRLAQRLDHEWTLLAAQRAERRASKWWNRPIVSLAAGVAIVVLALTLVSSLLPRGSSMSGSIVEGFLVGGAVIGVVGALIAIIVILRRR